MIEDQNAYRRVENGTIDGRHYVHSSEKQDQHYYKSCDSDSGNWVRLILGPMLP